MERSNKSRYFDSCLVQRKLLHRSSRKPCLPENCATEPHFSRLRKNAIDSNAPQGLDRSNKIAQETTGRTDLDGQPGQGNDTRHRP
ncbi:hypothetical protein [Mesorhizobium sp. M0854]|uniref:hypothetical protein n=1 Tax=unclassified Mesorhizobium TaxID=325217 RepID=UPI003335767D